VNRTFPPLAAVIIDQVLIIVFIYVGLVSHQEMTPDAILRWDGIFLLFGKAFPFMLAGFVAWAGLILRQYFKIMVSGLIVWASVVVLGLLFRVMNAQSVEPTFILTTALFTGILLMGWRLIAAVVMRFRPAEAA
jgi:hypothetical protein